MEFQSNLGTCKPTQIVNINLPVDSKDTINIFDECGCIYNTSDMQYAYSLDMACWSCFMPYETFIQNVVNLPADYYVKTKLQGNVSKIQINNQDSQDFSVQLDSGFAFSYYDPNSNGNQYNPYANMENAVSLYQNLTDTIANFVGVPVYYFKLKPDAGAKDITFKEYTLMNVDSVKQIKIVINDNQMPSSKPNFGDWGIDWETDWETFIAKDMFATAFGDTAQPMEGDLVYIPMMKRMWMVNEAYEEKKDAFMWNATYFTLVLVKYQEKDSVDLGKTEEFVNTLVKNKIEDLFGEEDNIDSGEQFTDTPNSAANNLYPIYESDAMRKYITCNGINFKPDSKYYKGTLISDNQYIFSKFVDQKIIYQKQYCGEDGTISFIFNPQTTDLNNKWMFQVLQSEANQTLITNNDMWFFITEQSKDHQGFFQNDIIEVNNIKVRLQQNDSMFKLSVMNNPNIILEYDKSGLDKTYFVFIRWNRQMNIMEMGAAEYKYPDGIPPYKLQPFHYYFDIDNMRTVTSKYDIEMVQDNKGDVIINNFAGTITNFKLFDYYNDNISEILQMLPTNKHLLINDTARKILDLPGAIIR